MRILLVGNCEPTHVGGILLRAFTGLGHDCKVFDESPYFAALAKSRLQRLAFHALGRPLTAPRLNADLAAAARRMRPQIVLVIKGAHFSALTLRQIREGTGAILVNYATDDPFSPVSGNPTLRGAIREYSLYACTKRAIIDDVRRAGSDNAVFVPFAYDPLSHFPEFPSDPAEVRRFTSDVVFVGAADQDRAGTFRRLLDGTKVELRLYGGRWHSEPSLRPLHRGMVLARDYRLACSGAKIALGFVRHSNRDGHSMRTFELPACGAFMLAERTSELAEFLEEGREVAAFGCDDELREKVDYYLRHESERRSIAAAGHTRITQGSHTYGDRAGMLLRLAGA